MDRTLITRLHAIIRVHYDKIVGRTGREVCGSSIHVGLLTHLGTDTAGTQNRHLACRLRGHYSQIRLLPQSLNLPPTGLFGAFSSNVRSTLCALVMTHS